VWRNEKNGQKDEEKHCQANTRINEKRSRTAFGKVKNLNGPLAIVIIIIGLFCIHQKSSWGNRYSLVSKATLPEIGRIGLCDAKLIPGEHSIGKDGFQLAEHMREDETKLGEVPPIM
jgi:hypothetical protein